MNKKYFLILFIGILIGTILSYSGDYFKSKQSTPNVVSKNKEVTPHRPRFGEMYTVECKNNYSDDPFPSEEDFVECLYRYSRMTPEEIRQEWVKLSQDFDSYKVNEFQIAKMDYLLLKWGRTSPRQVIQELKNGNYPNDSSIQMVMNDWIKRDPETALYYIIENKNEFQVSVMAEILASHAPLEMIKWIKSVPQEKSLLLLAYAIDALPAEQMANLTASMGKCDIIDDWRCGNIASKWATIDWDATVRWVDSLEHLKKEEREKILQDALSSLPPDSALSELEKRKDIDKISGLAKIADHLSTQNPQKALDWFLNHVSDEQIQGINGDLPLFFLDAYNASMVSHALQLPSGKKKDAVLETMSIKVWSDPKSGRECSLNAPTLEKRIELASLIGAQDKRDSTIKKILTEWSRSKPRKVLEWLELSSLPIEQKKYFILQCKKVIREKPMPYDL